MLDDRVLAATWLQNNQMAKGATMYNGNRFSNGTSRRGPLLPPLYLYIGIGILFLLALWAVGSFFRAGIEGYFALVAGVLLVLSNLRDMLTNPYGQSSSAPLLNTLVGGGLICFFLGKGGFPPLAGLWYVPAVLLVLFAAPLMLRRASFYTVYLGAARNVLGGVQRAVSSKIRTY